MLVGMAFSASAYTDNYPNTHRNTGKNIADLIAVAKTQIGYTELDTKTGYPIHPDANPGYTKYGASFGNPTGEWCAYFVSWCATNAGIPTSVVPRLGNCATTVEWYKKHSEFRDGKSGYKPKAGDIIFFNWSGGATAKHIGIVTGVSGDNVYTIEGNTGSDRGHMCVGRTRSRSAGYIVGYGIPAYNDAKTYAGSHSFTGTGTGSGSYSDSVKYTTSKLAVITTSATEITANNAMLHGSVSNGGRLFVTTAGFFFGTDKLQLAKYPVLSSLSKTQFDIEMDVASKVGELTPNTTYYYQTYVCIDGRDYLGPMYAVVTVNDIPQQLSLSETTIHVGIGQTSNVMWTQLPLGSTDKGVTWVSSDENIATVTDDGVVTGINYGQVTLTATTNYGSVSAECTAEVLIPTPENVMLYNNSESSITVKWDAVKNAEGYIIFRNTDADEEPSEYAEVDNVTEFKDNSVTPGVKYYYRVKTVAKQTQYNSDISESVCTVAKLNKPVGLSAEINDMWIELNWKNVDGAADYYVYRSTSENGAYINIGKAYDTKYIDRSVVADQIYYYKIIADNKNDRTRSVFSDVVFAKVLCADSVDIRNKNNCLISAPAVETKHPDAKIVRIRTQRFIPEF